jgi:hypothetical protein
VTSVDHRSGKLTLQTVDGPFTVTFPPAAVQGVEQGEQVTVAIGLRRQGAPSASPRTDSGPDMDSGSSKF